MSKRKAGPAPAPAARTPGDWCMRVAPSGVQIVNPAGIVVAKTPCCDRQAMADGVLLAAAPALLVALTYTMAELVRLHAQSSGDEAKRIWEAIDAASHVIASAEDRS